LSPCRSTGQPGGQISEQSGRLIVQPHLQKYFASRLTQIKFRTLAVSPTEGRIAIVTDAGWDAVDAGGAKDESADFADGEVVWS
jgi:hypothetical protein